MRKIPNLFEDSTPIPKTIMDALFDLGEHFNGYNCYAFTHYISFSDFHINYPKLPWKMHNEEIAQGFLFNELGEQLDKEKFIPLYRKYAEGFFQGYDSYEDEIRKKTSLFSNDSKAIAKSIFKRIEGWVDYGHFEFEDFCDDDFKKLIQAKFKVKNPKMCTAENFYEKGYQRGTIFKTWEIIIDNPSLFIDLFEEEKDQSREVSCKLEESYLNESQNQTLKISNDPEYLVLDRSLAGILFSELRRYILDDAVSEDIFIQALSNKRSKKTIKLSCETAEFAFLLKLLEDKNVLPKPIEKKIGDSKLFLSKRNGIISYDNLRGSRSISKGTGSASEKIKAMTVIADRIAKKIAITSN